MHAKRLFLAGIAIAVLACAGSASATTINFDDVVGGNSIFSLTDVSNNYAGLGVTFYDPAGGSGALNASVLGSPAASLPNVFFVDQHQGDDSGDLQINFTSGTGSVDLDVFLSSDYYLSYVAYGSSGVLTSGSLPANSFSLELQHLSLSSLTPITELTLTSHPDGSPNYFGNFSLDNLSFGSGSAAPEPADWALIIGGFGLAGAALRRRRAQVAA